MSSREELIQKLEILGLQGCLVFNCDPNGDLEEMKHNYKCACEYAVRKDLYKKLDMLVDLGYLPDYESRQSADKLKQLYEDVLINHKMFQALCDRYNLPITKLYNHIHYPIFLNTPSSKQHIKNITEYFNMVFEMKITTEEVLMSLAILAFDAFLNYL